VLKCERKPSESPGFLHRLNHSKWKTKQREFAGPPV
jgi:hypothetical protein